MKEALVLLLILVALYWRSLVWPFLHAVAAVISWHLLFVYAMSKHEAFGEIVWRNLPRHMLERFALWFDCVPQNTSNDIFHWGGVFRWHVKPYTPEQKEPQE